MSAAAATLDGTTYSATGEGEAQITDMPAGLYAVKGRMTATWGTGTDFSYGQVVVTVGSSEVAADTGSVGDVGGSPSSLPLKLTASDPAVAIAEGQSITATSTLFTDDTGASLETTISAVRLGAAAF